MRKSKQAKGKKKRDINKINKPNYYSRYLYFNFK